MAILSFDFSRPPNQRQLTAWARRQDRLAALQESLEQAGTAFAALRAGKAHTAGELKIRDGFSYRVDGPATSSSDRKVPRREDRPPATRLATSHGAALRFELIALATAQACYRAGSRWHNPLPLRPPSSSSGRTGWVDLLVSPSTTRGSGRTRMHVLDKKLRQVHNALKTMHSAELVALPNSDKKLGLYEEFVLLDERGPRQTGPQTAYEVPKANTGGWFCLPFEFITNGWVHLLEDSEITLLLMVACGLGRNPGEENVAVPADVRLLQYGIGPDAFASHVMLSKLGLLNVDEVGRHDDGKAMEYRSDGAYLHRLRLLREGFSQNALPTLQEALRHELARA